MLAPGSTALNNCITPIQHWGTIQEPDISFTGRIKVHQGASITGNEQHFGMAIAFFDEVTGAQDPGKYETY